MTKHQKLIERIARDICWAEFSPAGRKGKTKRSYWNSISGSGRASCIRDAERFVWLLGALPITTINAAHDAKEIGNG